MSLSHISNKPLQLDEIQDKEFDILCFIQSFCEKENIRFFLCGGTFLGAVRHKDFIPWDDDVDIIMMRDDYIRFISLFPKDNPKFKLLSPGNPTCYLPYSKIIDKTTICFEKNKKLNDDLNFVDGLFVDVFYFDYVDSSRIKAKLKQGFCVLSYAVLTSRIMLHKDFKHWVLYFAFFLVSRSLILRLVFKTGAIKTKNRTSKIWCAVSPTKKPIQIYDYSLIASTAKYVFRGRQFIGFADYNSYLKSMYNDYMTIPREEDRISHSIDAFIRR